MKKLLPAFLFLLASLGASAQITLPDADVGAVGSTFVMGVDTLLDSNFTIGSAGPNQSWDFSNLDANELDTIRFFDPANTPYDSSFPTANLAITQGSIDGFAYLELTSSSLEIIGLAGDPAGVGQVFVLEQANPSTVATFPFTYQDGILDTSIVDVTVAFSAFPGSDSVRLKTQANRNLVSDAWGDLSLFSGTYSTIRVKEITNNADSVWALLPFIGWTLVQDSSYTDSTFTWWRNGGGYILAQADYSGPDLVQVSYQDPNIVSRPEPGAALFQAFPNPASHEVNIRRKNAGPADLELVDVLGRSVWSTSTRAHEEKIPVQDLPEGTYFLKIHENNSGKVYTGRILVTH